MTTGPKGAPSPPGALAVGARVGRYIVRGELGRGGMAVVYRAEDTTLRREVALKVLLPHLVAQSELTGRFLREARAAGALDHPGILKVFDVGGGEGEGDGSEPPFIVMELIRGRSLKDFLERSGTPLAELAAMLGAALAEALHAAHTAGVIHRDVKPANVMISDDGRPILCDFGVARVAHDDAIATQSGLVLGTPVFMPPEQALGRKVDARSDVYALGATLYQAATGALPFQGTTAAVLSAVTRGELVPPGRRNPAMGGTLAKIIVRAMAVEPGERFASAAELAEALAAVARVPGLGDRAEELRAYFADAAAWNARARPLILEAGMARAEAAHGRREIARALAECDRVLALDPEHEGATRLVVKITRGERWRRRAMIGAFVVGGGLLAGAGAKWLVARGDGDAALVAAAADADAATDADAEADTAAAADADTAAATAPDAGAATVALLPDAGRRVAAPRGAADAGLAVALVAPPDAAPAAVPPPAVLRGRLLVKIGPTCQLTIDGKPAGQSPMQTPLELPAGVYRVRCENLATGAVVDKDVEVKADQTEVVRDVLAVKVAVTIGTRGPVRVDGVEHAPGARLDLTAGSHRVERLDGGRVVETRYVQIPSSPCTLRDTPALECR